MLRNARTGKRAEVSSQAQFPSNIFKPLPNLSLISHTHPDLIKAGLVLLSSPSPTLTLFRVWRRLLALVSQCCV